MSARATGSVSDGEMPRPSLRETARVFGKIGLLGFGGPAGQIALMHRMLVEERRWIPEDRFLHALNFCMLLPGPEAQQLATYIGWLLHGTRGGILAGTLFILPGLLVILALSTVYVQFGERWFAGLFYGLKSAVLVIVLEALLRIARRALTDGWSLVIAAVALLLLFAFAAPFPLVVLLAGFAGFFAAPHTTQNDPTAAQPQAAPTDRLASAARLLLTGGVLWALPPLLLGLLLGWNTIYPQLALFFSKLAIVTFGGAYAVLAYVVQAAVTGYGWLQPGEMLDGLALAETTPGPLILVLCFVGFLSAYRDPAGLSPLIGGLTGGLLTAWVSFLPSFLFVLIGAPYMERLRANPRLSGALRAITAAVVGVMLNLALWFVIHALFGQTETLSAGPLSLLVPVWGTLDPVALGLTLIAGLCLFALRMGLAGTLAVSAVLGYAAHAFAAS